VPKPQELRRLPHGSLGAVGPHRMVTEVECQWLPLRQGRKLGHAVHHTDRESTRVAQFDGVAAPMWGDNASRGARQPVQVGPGVRGEGRPDEARTDTLTHHQTRCARPPATQKQRLRGPIDGGGAEVDQEPLGARQVRLLELQPGQASHLDDRIACSTRMLPAPGPDLTVQGPMWILFRRRVRFHDRPLPPRSRSEAIISHVIECQKRWGHRQGVSWSRIVQAGTRRGDDDAGGSGGNSA
jgi:hypothetical protein